MGRGTLDDRGTPRSRPERGGTGALDLAPGRAPTGLGAPDTTGGTRDNALTLALSRERGDHLSPFPPGEGRGEGRRVRRSWLFALVHAVARLARGGELLMGGLGGRL